MKRANRQTVTGFTLLEALLASVVLAMTVVAITMPFTAGARNEQVDARRTVAVSLAQEMMEEVLAQPFEDDQPVWARNPGPEPGETARSLFDNIDDYNGYEEPAGSISDLSGAVIDEATATDLSRHVTTSYVYVPGQDLGLPTNFIHVIVELKHRGQILTRFSRLVYAYD